MLATSRISRWLIPALLLTVLIFVGCSSEDSTTPPPAAPDQTAEEIFTLIIEPQEENDQVLEDLFLAGMDTMAAMDSVLVRFLQDPAVSWGEVGEQGIAISYANGMVGGIFLDPQDGPDEEPDLPEFIQTNPQPQQGLGDKATPKKAIFLNPHYYQRTRFADPIISNYGLMLGPAGYSDLEVYTNSQVTLDSYTHLTDHRIIHFYAHGWAWPSSANIQEVYLMTGEAWSADTYFKYWNDITRGDIPLVRYHGGGHHFFVSPAFIHKHNNLDDDTMVYGGFCYSNLGSWPEYMVEHAGAGGYFGFDWSVLTAWNAAWNRSCINNLLNNQANPRHNVNDWLNTDYPKWYSYDERVVHINYTGDQTLILFDSPDIPCDETEQEHDDVFVQGKATVFYGGIPANEVPVRFDYRKMHCDGHWGSVDPVTGETGTDGVWVANMLGSFHLDNTQDYILVRATVNGQVQEKIYPFGVFNGLDGSSIFFPMRAEFTFNF